MSTYLLNKRKRPYKVSFFEWGDIFQTSGKRHLKDKFIKGIRISTVFLGLDHSYLKNQKPQIFETMVFEDESYSEIYLDRYATYKEAQKGHRKAVRWVLNGCMNEIKSSKIIHNKQKSIKIYINQ